MSYTICYYSNAHPNLTTADIEVVFDQAATFNNENDISGILLHSFGDFFQVLEGEKEKLLDLFYNKISNDERHTNIFPVIEKDYESRIFEGYKSKFNTVKTEEELQNILDYLKQNGESSTHNKLLRLLKTFTVLIPH